MADFLFERIQYVAPLRADPGIRVVSVSDNVGDDPYLRLVTVDPDFPAPADPKQHWWRQHIFFNPDLNRNTYAILNRTYPWAIDAQGGNLVDNTALQVFPESMNPNQRWRINDATEFGGPNSPVFIFADNTQEVWDFSSDGFLRLFRLNPDSPAWVLEPIETVTAVVIQSRATNLVLDVPNSSQVAGTQVQQFGYNGGFNQFWQVPDHNTFRPITCVSSGKVLDFASSNGEPGIVFQNDPNGKQSQLWSVGEVAQDEHGLPILEIVNVADGSFLTASNDGSVVAAFPTHGLNQQWSLVTNPPEPPVDAPAVLRTLLPG